MNGGDGDNANVKRVAVEGVARNHQRWAVLIEVKPTHVAPSWMPADRSFAHFSISGEGFPCRLLIRSPFSEGIAAFVREEVRSLSFQLLATLQIKGPPEQMIDPLTGGGFSFGG